LYLSLFFSADEYGGLYTLARGLQGANPNAGEKMLGGDFILLVFIGATGEDGHEALEVPTKK